MSDCGTAGPSVNGANVECMVRMNDPLRPLDPEDP